MLGNFLYKIRTKTGYDQYFDNYLICHDIETKVYPKSEHGHYEREPVTDIDKIIDEFKTLHLRE